MTVLPNVRPLLGLASAMAVLGVSAAPALAVAPTISGANGDIWNTSRPAPTYVITGAEPGVTIAYRVTGGTVSRGPSPVTVTLPDLKDGGYTLTASEQTLSNGRDRATRTFRVDLTPPTATIRQPVAGTVFDQGASAEADFSCDGAVTCTGTVADGAAIPTAAAGSQTFAVTAVDDGGNQVVASAPYVVRGPTLTPPETAPASDPPAPATPRARIAAFVPPTIHAVTLSPRKGANLTTRRPLLRWPARRSAQLYNLQVFRLRGSTAKKVLSVFPRGTAYRIPAGRVAFGDRYVWRVWPYLSGGYPKSPLGLSYFDVLKKAGSGG